MSMTLAEALSRVGIDTENVRAKAESVRTRAEKWLETQPAPETLKTFVRQFVRMGTDLDLPLTDLAILVGAVAYVILPLDFIADFIPLLGWSDDLTVTRLAMRALRRNWDRQKTG